MTVQGVNEVGYDGQEHGLLAPMDIVTPAVFGMPQPQMLDTGCRHGYRVRYEVVDDVLLLQWMEVGLKTSMPVGDTKPHSTSPTRTVYSDIGMVVPYDGPLYLGRDPDHSSFSAIPSYLFSVTLYLERGCLLDVAVSRNRTRSEMDALLDRETMGAAERRMADPDYVRKKKEFLAERMATDPATLEARRRAWRQQLARDEGHHPKRLALSELNANEEAERARSRLREQLALHSSE